MKTENKKLHTTGEIIEMMRACKTKKQASALVKKLMKEHEATDENLLRSNLGYLTGYLGPKEGMELLNLFETEHPIFGKTRPMADEAFKIGLEMGSRISRIKDK